MKRIIRVFPVRTNATPDDELVRIATTPHSSTKQTKCIFPSHLLGIDDGLNGLRNNGHTLLR